jgi:hypothetical protein
MLEYELNGKIYTESDLIKMAGGKDKLPAYIKSKGFKPASKKTKQPTKLDERFGEDVYKKTFGFENPTKDQFSEINKTKKKKPVAKKWNEVVNWQDLAAEETTAVENLQKRVARFGLTPEEKVFGFNRLTLRGDKRQQLYSTTDNGRFVTPADLPEVIVGPDASKEELIASAKILNEYIGKYGNKDYIKKVKTENPNLVRDTEQKIQAPSRPLPEKLKLYNEDLINEFKNKEEYIRKQYESFDESTDSSQKKLVTKVTATRKDFDTQEKYNQYKLWKKTGQIPFPSNAKLEKFIGEYNDNYRASKSAELMSDAPEEQRTMLLALEAEREDKKVQEKVQLNTESAQLDKDGKALSEKIAKFEKTPPTKQEYDEIQKEYFAFQNRSNEYNRKALALNKDFNNIKAVSEAASKDYRRLNQTGTFLKQTGLALVGAAEDIRTTTVAFETAILESATTDETFGESYTRNKNFLKGGLLDLVYGEQKAASKELESYQRDLQIKDIKNMKDFGRWGAGILTQMPSSMAMAVTGEAALPLFFLSGYGSKQYEIASLQEAALSRLQYNADQINKGLVAAEDMSEIQKQIASDKKTLNISEGAKLTSQLLAGTAEVLLEKYGTLGIIKQTDNILRAIPPQEIKRQLKVIGREMGKSAGVEAWTEGLTQLANNFGDIHLLGQDKNYFDGVPDAMAAGAFMGPGFSAMGGAGAITNNITKAVVSELASKEEFKARNRKLDEIKKLTGLEDVTGLTKAQLNKLKLQPPVRKAVEELIDQMDGEDLRILDRLGKDFSMEDAREIGNFNQKLREITRNWNEASKTAGLEDSQLKSLKDYYQKQYNDVFNEREAILTDKQLTGKNKKENAQKRITFEATAGYGLYKARLTRKTYLEKLAGFDKLSSEEKQRYNDLALLELNQDATMDQLSNKEIDSKARELYAGEEIGKQLDRDIQAANDFSTETGLNVNVETINSKKELLEKYDKIIDEEELNDLLNGKTNGFNIDDNTVVVYKPNAIKNGHTSTGSHEILHTVLSKAFKGEEANKNGIKLLEYLKTAQPSLYAAVEERMKAYDPTYHAYGEEVFNALSDSFSDGKIPNDNVFTQISKVVNKITKGAFGTSSTFDINNINTDSGKALFDTIKAYNQKAGAKKTKTGQNIRFIYSDTEDKAAEGTPATGFKASKAKVAEVQKKIDNLEDQLDKGEIDYEDYESRLKIFENDLAKAKLIPEEALKPEVKKEVTEEEADKEIIKNEKGSVSSDKVQKIYEEQGVNGAQAIIDLFKPITKKLVNKRMDAPGFDRELLTSEIETGDGGILYLIRSYKPEKGVPLAAYINKQLPLRAIAASRRVLDKDFSKDVTEEKGLIAEETVSEAKEKPKYDNALEAKVFTPEILKTATGKIITIVRTLKNRIDAPVTLNRTVTPLISEIRDEVGKQLDIDIKTMLGGKKDGVLVKELLRNKKYILENMTTTWLMGKDGQGGIPQAVQKQIDGKWVSFPDWVGQKIDREKTTTDQAGRTSGAELVRRLPNVNNNVSNEEFLAQIIGPDGNPIRGRKESLSKAMAEEGAFDIINNDLENQGPIYEALSTNQTRLGVEVMENFPAVFQKDSERGNVKQSKTFNNFNDSQKQYIINNSINLASELANINYNLIPDEDDIFKALQKVYNNGTISNENLKELSKDIKSYYTPILAPLLKKQSTDYVKNFINASLEENSNKLDTDAGKIPDSITQLFTQQEEIRQAQSFTSKFISNLGKKYKGEELNARLRKIGAFLAYQAQIGDDSFTIKDNKLVPQIPRLTKKGEKKRNSYQLYSSKPAFWTMAKFALKGDLGKGFSRNRKGYIEDSARKLYANKNNAEYLENKRLTAIENQDFLYEILDWYYNPANKVPETTKAMLWASLNSSQETPLRKAAIAKWVFDEASGSKDFGELRYEHLKSVDKTRSQLHKMFNSNLSEQERKAQFANIMEDFNVAIIPVSMDKKIGALGFQTKGIAGDISEGARYYNIVTMGNPALYSLINLDPNAEVKTLGEGFVRFSKTFNPQNGINIDAVTNSLTPKYSKSSKGISVFDFDDTTGITKGSVLYTMPDGSKGKLNAEEFAKEGAKFLEDGAVFDFSEFSKVVDGKPGPMVEKMKKMIGKFGPDNFFILTARPPDAAGPIHEFLSSIGIDIPLENITGLGNSTAQAKADWMVAKAAEGYNDFYFSDDAIQNVKAVENALKVLDVKSKIQQAKLKLSNSMSIDFNRIIEENKGVESYKVYSDITARRRGLKKNRFDFYVPPSAADFELLLYNFMGKGALGEEHKKFFQDALINPYINGVDMMGAVRQSIKKEYKALLKSFPEVRKDLEKLTPNKDFTYDQAMRVAIWSQYGTEIPGLSQRDAAYLTDLINNDPELVAFKDGLIVMGRQKEGWLPPGNFWDSDTIVSDLYNITEGAGRKKFLSEFIENVENIFGKFENGRLVGPNINKVEAVYGTNVREALEDSIYRMINGKNRSFGQDKETTAWSSWVNGSTGAIMFMNTRSAALQMLGAVNFLNWRDNNPFNAGKAFLNQPQYWKDFARIWNSDKLKERRGGLREDVASAEIANAAAGSKNKVVAVTSYLLKIGYTPTQLADSFAIASGGAPFYRNRINSYLKEGLTEQEAEAKAWQDFSKISDETQQSGDPKDISKQQSSGAGRLLLVFQNFTMQQSRIVKKAVLDLKNGRGDAKTNIAKIAYYLAVQNIMFSTLQQGLFAVMFDDDEEDEDKKKKKKTDAAIDVANGVLDSILRGTGFVGGVTATLKNTVVKYLEERAKKQKAEYAKVVLEAANMSPPIGSKLRKTYSALQQTKYDKDLIEARGWGVMQDGRVHLGPMYSVTGKLVEVGTNFPMDRLVNKVENVSQAFNSENTAMQRLATGMGYSPWTVGIEGTKGDILIKENAKAKRKEEGWEKSIITREENKIKLRDSLDKLSSDEYDNYMDKKIEEKIRKRDRRLEILDKLNATK